MFAEVCQPLLDPNQFLSKNLIAVAVPAMLDALQSLFEAFDRLAVPSISVVHGAALGGGCELALACHLRIASENAKFGQPEVNLGIIPGFGGTQRLTRAVGINNARELVYTGKVIDAAEAKRIGLVCGLSMRKMLTPWLIQKVKMPLSAAHMASRSGG